MPVAAALGPAPAGPSRRRADPGPPDALAPGQDQTYPGFPRPARVPEGGTADRSQGERGARSAASTGAPARVRRSLGLPRVRRSPGPRVRRIPDRPPVRRSQGLHRPGRPWGPCRWRDHRAAGSGPAGEGPDGPAAGAAAGTRQAVAATDRSNRPRPLATRSPRRRRSARSPRHVAGRRGVHPACAAWADHTHRGPDRCRHVPPGTSWTHCPAAPRDLCPYLLSVGRRKSPVEPRRLIVINCT